MSQRPKPNSSAKPVNSISIANVDLPHQRSEQDLLQELKEACLNAAETYVALHVPHGRVLSLLLDFVARHGLTVLDRWDEDDIDSDVDWDPNEQ